MPWPLSQDYNEAIQSAAANFADPDLRRGAAVVNTLGLPRPFSGNFADVYEVDCPDGGRWAVKCFTREVPGLRERYQQISRYLGQARLPFTVDFTYLEQGIRVAGRWYPVLKMQWVEGLTLNQFVSQFLDKPTMLEALLRLWARMAKYLRSAGAAHCDLQHGNVLLVPGANANSLALKLIDYDGMYVPALAGSKSGEVGHPSYQHPQRLREGTYSLEVDRFPLLLIATALGALSIKGRPLWQKYDNADNLLFREADLRDPAHSELFRDLSRFDDPTTAALTAAVRMALKGNMETAPLLDEVLADARPVVGPVPTPAAIPVAAAPKGIPAVAPVLAPAPSAAGIWDFSESIVDVSPVERSRPRIKKKTRKAKPGRVPVAVWVGGAAALAFVILGGGAVLALVLILGIGHAKPPEKPVDENRPIVADAKTEHEDKPAEMAKPAEEAAPIFPADEKVGEVRRFDLDNNPLYADGRLAALTPDQTRIVRVSQATLGVWQVADAQMMLRTDKGHKNPSCMSVDPMGRYAAVGNFDGVIEIWDLKDLAKKATLSGAGATKGASPVFAVAFAPDRKHLLASGPDPKVHLWDWDKGVEVGELKQDDTVGWPGALAFSPDGKHYVVGTTSGVLRVVRVDGNQEVARFVGPDRPATCVAIAPDNQRAVSGGQDGAVHVWDLKTGTERAVFKNHQRNNQIAVLTVAVSSDGRWVLSAGEDKVLRLWELDGGREVFRFEGHIYPVTGVGFFKDGRHAFSGGKDNGVRIWRLPPADYSGRPSSVDTASNDKDPPPKPEPKPVVKKTDSRLPVPDAAALAAAEKEVKEAYKADYAKRGLTDVVNLCTKLRIDGSKASDKPAPFRYVLLREARDLAAKDGSYWSTITAVEEMARIFAEDVWELKADALEKVDAKAGIEMDRRFGRENTTKPYHRGFALSALIAADEAGDENAFAAAERLLKIAQANAVAAGEAKLKAQVPERLRDFAALRKTYEPVAEALSTLASRPEDPQANLVVGKYYSLAKGDWNRGLARLALSSDSRLKDLAKSDLETGSDPDAMAALGDRYAAQAEMEGDPAKTHLLWRACYWYERAEGLYPKPSGTKVAATRAEIEKKLPPARPFVIHVGWGSPSTWAAPTDEFRRLLLLSGGLKLNYPKGIRAALGIGDTVPGEDKSLIIVYRHRGRVRLSITKDSDAVSIPLSPGFVDTEPGKPAPGQELTILYARYGIAGAYADVTAKVQSAVKGMRVNAKPADLGLGESITGKPKWLVVVCQYGDTVYMRTTPENSPISLNPPVAGP